VSICAIIVYVRHDKEKAFSLRREGNSYTTISKELCVPVSTLSNWFHGVDFSEDIRKMLTDEAVDANTIRIKSLNKERGLALTLRYEQARKEASIDLINHINNPLFVSAVVAYWGEGDKLSKNHLRLTNTDPQMIILFYTFLLQICKIDQGKIKGALFIYEDLDPEVCKQYWLTQTGLTHFHKTMVLPSRHKIKKLPFGICTIVVSNTYLKQKMLVWIDQLPKMVLNTVSKQ
jgi:hypothetical protein